MYKIIFILLVSINISISNIITWDIQNAHNNMELSHNQIKNIINESFNSWSKYINIKFKENNIDSNIKISFTKYNHYCIFRKSSYILPSILAHANTEPVSFHNIIFSFIHINLDNTSNNKLNILTTLTHEIGHVLGFNHNNNFDSIMYPHLKKNNVLHIYDKNIAIQTYGSSVIFEMYIILEIDDDDELKIINFYYV